MAKSGGKQTNSLIRIADVLKTGDRLNTGEKGVAEIDLPGLKVAVCAIPAGMQGGDFYGVIDLKENCIAVFLGDIAGHDFSSSILATSVMKTIEENQEGMIQPHLFLRSMNRKLYRSLSSVGRFFTAAIAIINVASGVVSISSAGHPPALLKDSLNGGVEPLMLRAMPLGFEREQTFSILRRDFYPGSKLLMYTDGVSGARNAEREEFGQKRLETLMNRAGDGAKSLVRRIITAHDEYSRGGPETDDRTIICIESK